MTFLQIKYVNVFKLTIQREMQKSKYILSMESGGYLMIKVVAFLTLNQLISTLHVKLPGKKHDL